jgi:hypothetical protein
MSATRDDVDYIDGADRLARVKLSCTIEPGDLRVTGLVSELGAAKVLDYLEAAVHQRRGRAAGDVVDGPSPAGEQL